MAMVADLPQLPCLHSMPSQDAQAWPSVVLEELAQGVLELSGVESKEHEAHCWIQQGGVIHLAQ